MSFNSFDIKQFQGLEKDALMALARASEAAERYEDMCQFMKTLVGKSTTLTVEERNLLSVAYKNVVSSRRASWRSVTSDDSAHAKEYKSIVESELDDVCTDILNLLTDSLIPNANESGIEEKVFYRKMAGDYNRYLAEFKNDETYQSKARDEYQQAYNLACGESGGLAPTHPIRLGLALNFSVCYYEILGDKKKACELAKQAFDDAIAKLDQLDEASYKDSTLIMQLLRDNLTLWTSDSQNEVDDIE